MNYFSPTSLDSQSRTGIVAPLSHRNSSSSLPPHLFLFLVIQGSCLGSSHHVHIPVSRKEKQGREGMLPPFIHILQELHPPFPLISLCARMPACSKQPGRLKTRCLFSQPCAQSCGFCFSGNQETMGIREQLTDSATLPSAQGSLLFLLDVSQMYF